MPVTAYWQRARRAARGRHYDAAPPQVAAQQVAGAGLALVKPFQSWRSRAQIERKWPAADNYLCCAKKPVALLRGSHPRRAGRQVARRGELGPGFANLAVEPAAGVDQLNRRVGRLDLGTICGADALGGQNVNRSHHRVSESTDGSTLAGSDHEIGFLSRGSEL